MFFFFLFFVVVVVHHILVSFIGKSPFYDIM